MGNKVVLVAQSSMCNINYFKILFKKYVKNKCLENLGNGAWFQVYAMNLSICNSTCMELINMDNQDKLQVYKEIRERHL